MPQLGLGSSLSRGGVLSGFENKYSLSLDGTNDHITLGSAITLGDGQAFTMSAWIKKVGGGRFVIMSGNGANYARNVFEVRANEKLAVTSEGATVDNEFDPVLSLNKWYHVALVYSGTVYTAYINSTAESTTYTSDDQFTDFQWIGIGSNGSTNPFEGNIDEVAIWDVALDADAITAIYNSGTPIALDADDGNYDNSGDLQGWWRMGDGTLDNHGAFDGDDNGIIVDMETPPTLGSEMISNGASLSGADWTVTGGLSSSWTFADGKAVFDDVANHDLSQVDTDMVSTFSTGVIYKMTYTISDLSDETGNAAYFQILSDDQNPFDITGSTYMSAINGTHTVYFKANSDNNGNGLRIKASTNSTGSWKIDDISVKPVTGGNIGFMINMTASDIVEATP